MWNIQISYTFFFSIFTNQMVCELIKPEDGNSKSKSEDVYQKKNIDRAIIVRPLPIPPHISPYFKPPPPIILTIEVPNSKPNIEFNPYITDFSHNPRFGPGSNPGPRLIPGYNQGISTVQNPTFEFNGPGHFINLMDFIKEATIGLGSSLQPVQYFRPQNEYVDPLYNHNHENLDQPTESSDVEILKSLGYTFPSETTFNHPISFAKEYLLDEASSNSVKNIKQNVHEVKTPVLLTGEEQTSPDNENDEILTKVESKTDKTLNKMETIRTHYPYQYYSSNQKAITFENAENKPKNIYDIITAEKNTPKEMEMTKDGIKQLKTTTRVNNEGMKGIKSEVTKDDEIKKSIETEQIEETVVDENFDGNMTLLDEDSDLSVSELEKSDDDKIQQEIL